MISRWWVVLRRSFSRATARLVALVLVVAGDSEPPGSFHTLAFLLIVVAVVLVAASLRLPSLPPRRAEVAIACAVLALGNLVQFWLPHGQLVVPTLVVACGCVIAVLGGPRSLRIAGLLGASLAALVAIPASGWEWGHLNFDVFDAVTAGGSAVAHLRNPYDATFQLQVWQTPPGLGYLRTEHFVYGPGVALLAAPGALVGDVRIGSLVAAGLVVVVATLVARRSSLNPASAAALVVAVPLTAGMIHAAWVDVYSVAGYVGWLALRRRHRRLAVTVLAVVVAGKPLMLPAFLVPLMWSVRVRREAVAVAALAVLLVAPFVIVTGAAAFYSDVAGYLADLPPRSDGLTLQAFLFARTGHFGVPDWVGIVVPVAVLAGLARTKPRDWSDVHAAGALVLMTALLLAKWAFFNYYYCVAMLLVLAVVSEGIAVEEDERDVRLPCARQSRQSLQPDGTRRVRAERFVDRARHLVPSFRANTAYWVCKFRRTLFEGQPPAILGDQSDPSPPRFCTRSRNDKGLLRRRRT